MFDCGGMAFSEAGLIPDMLRPAGITAIAFLFALVAAYLWTIAAIMLLSPGAIPLTTGSPFMYGLELAGPYMALLVGAGWGLIGWRLFRLNNWARWAAMGVLALGIGWLVPKISAAELGLPLFWYGLQIAVRVAAAWYLAQAPVVLDAFARKS